MLLSFCVASIFLLRGASYLVLPCSLFECFFFFLFFFFCFVFISSPYSIVVTSLGEEREVVYVLLVHLFVYFARVNFCPFSLPLGVRGCLRLVIVALPGLFY